MGEYRIAYDGKVIRRKRKLRGDRGVIERAEAKALAIVRSLIKQGAKDISYREIVESETLHRTGFIRVTWQKG